MGRKSVVLTYLLEYTDIHFLKKGKEHINWMSKFACPSKTHYVA